MNFTVIKEHRDFFRNNHYLECEIFSNEETDKIAQNIDETLAVRLSTLRPKRRPNVNDKFNGGFDLWRKNQILKKFLLSRSLAEVASQLIELRPLRYGYDRLLPAINNDLKNGAYFDFLHRDLTLSEISSIQGVLCGGMLCLDSGNNISEDNSPLFSKTKGHVVFFSKDFQLPLKDLTLREGSCYLMFVYVNAKAVYYRQDLDPHVHEFREHGYQFGDKLTDLNNPIVYV